MPLSASVVHPLLDSGVSFVSDLSGPSLVLGAVASIIGTLLVINRLPKS